MSKESLVPLTRTIDIGERGDRQATIPWRFLRFPIRDRNVAEALGCDKESGHRVPPVRRRRRR